MNEEIEFNYFYKMFRKEYQEILEESAKKKIELEKDEMEKELIRIFPKQSSTKEEILEAYNKSLIHICKNYISLSDSKMDIFPKDSFEFVDSILGEIEENPYRDSFLISLQFIYEEYLACLEAGTPILFESGKASQESYMEITLDSQLKVLQFNCVNMSLLEQTKTMTEFVTMQKNQQVGPFQKVKYRYRKDI